MLARWCDRCPVVSLWLIFAVNGAVLASWAPRIPAVVDSVGLSDGQLGAALLGVAAGSIPALLLAGRVLRRVRAGAMCVGSGVAFTLSLPLIALANDAIGLTASLAVAGAASGALDVAMNTAAVQYENQTGRRLLSRLHGGYSAGVLAGSAMGTVAAAAGVPVPVHFMFTGITLLLVLLAAARGVLQPVVRPAAAPGPRRAVGLPVLLLVVAIAALFAEGAATDWSALLVSRDLGGGAALGGAAVTAFTLAMAVSRALGDRTAAIFGTPAVVVGGGTLAGAALAVGALQTSGRVTIAALAIAGLGLGPLFPLLIRYAGTLAGDTGRSTATVSAVGYLAYLAGPPVIGVAADRVGLPLTLACAALGIAAVITIAGSSVFRASTSRRSGGDSCSTPTPTMINLKKKGVPTRPPTDLQVHLLPDRRPPRASRDITPTRSPGGRPTPPSRWWRPRPSRRRPG